jgi:hypothetical protein
MIVLIEGSTLAGVDPDRRGPQQARTLVGARLRAVPSGETVGTLSSAGLRMTATTRRLPERWDLISAAGYQSAFQSSPQIERHVLARWPALIDAEDRWR